VEPAPPRGYFVVDTPPRRLILRDAFSSRFQTRNRAEAGRSTRGLVTGCLYDAEGNRVTLSQRRPDMPKRQPLCLDEAWLDPASAIAAPRLQGRTLFLGNFMNHYGHFITEGLSRLWAQEDMARYDHIVAFAANADRGRYRPRAFHRYFLDLLGMDLSRLRVLTEPVRFEEVTVPEQLWLINCSVNRALRPLHETIRARHAGKPTGRVFLSRAAFFDPRLANMAAIESVFAGFGFAVHYPENMTSAEQLTLFAGAEIIAGPSGSGLHNSIFARPGTTIIDVGDPRSARAPTRMQQMADQLAETQPHFLPYGGPNGRSESGRRDIADLAAQLMRILGETPSRGALPVLRRRLARLPALYRRLRGRRL
jgi:hypothetical protein